MLCEINDKRCVIFFSLNQRHVTIIIIINSSPIETAIEETRCINLCIYWWINKEYSQEFPFAQRRFYFGVWWTCAAGQRSSNKRSQTTRNVEIERWNDSIVLALCQCKHFQWQSSVSTETISFDWHAGIVPPSLTQRPGFLWVTWTSTKQVTSCAVTGGGVNTWAHFDGSTDWIAFLSSSICCCRTSEDESVFLSLPRTLPGLEANLRLKLVPAFRQTIQ